MNECINRKYGDMLYAYELGMLSESERQDFEQHLIECEFCSRLATENLEIAGIIRHDQEIHEHAKSLVAREVHEEAPVPRATPVKKGTFLRPWSYSIPVAAAILLFLILMDWQIDIRTSNEVVSADNRLVVLNFANIPDSLDRDNLSDITTNLLITDLGESENLRIMSGEYINSLAMSLGYNKREIHQAESASEVARLARATWILTGSILRIDSGLIVTSQLVEAATGDVLASQRVMGEPGEDIFAVVDNLSSQVKRDLPLPISAGKQPDRSVANITTHSAEAYRHYLQGIEYVARTYYAEAIEQFERALELDSTFAMVYYFLAQYDDGQFINQAMEYREHASKKEKYYIESRYYLLHQDTARAISLLNKLLNEYPDETLAYSNLGYIYRKLGDPRTSITYYETAIKIDPFYRDAYNSLAYAYNAVGDHEQSILAINRYIEIAPGEPNPYDTRGDLFLHNYQFDAAMESYRQALRIKPDYFTSLLKIGHLYLQQQDYRRADSCYRVCALSPESGMRAYSRQCLAGIPLLRGQFTRTLEVIDSSVVVDLSDKEYGAAIRKYLMKARVLVVLERYEEAIATIISCQNLGGEVTGQSTLQCNTALVQALADAGQFDRAERTLEVIRSEHLPVDSTIWNYWYLRGYIDFTRGKIEPAVRSLAIANESSCPLSVGYMLARAYLANRQLSQATVQFETIAKGFSPERFYYGFCFMRTHYYLGRTYEESQWIDKAIEQYEIFLSWWGDSDTDLPEITDARQRLARLRAES
ncbi:MAG: tetratricopeptide repeat protein [candidate division Zixibacteria bacterium]|nr:tetratricopeptide repeat protein [candidate division Zixibacteria bacterium]